MAINNERMEALSKYLASDAERLEMLQALSAEEAVAKINADGYDYTTEELIAFEEEMNKMAGQQDGELNEESLDNVAGGVGLLSCVIGYWVGRERAWRYKHWGR